MTNYVPFQQQHPASHMMTVMTAEAVQAQVTKTSMAVEGMRGSWNMHLLMTCSSVTCTPRNVTSHFITYRSGNTDCVILKEHVQVCMNYGF